MYTVAHYGNPLITAVKCFLVQAPGVFQTFLL